MKCKLSPVAFDAEFWGLLWRKGIKPLTPAGIRRTWRFLSGRGERPWGRDTFINRDFATRIGLKERFHALQAHRLGPPGNSRLSHWHEVTWGGIIHQIESTNKAAARFGIELRHPFRDRRLMEFCLALPAGAKAPQRVEQNGHAPGNGGHSAGAGPVPRGTKWTFGRASAIRCCSWSRSGPRKRYWGNSKSDYPEYVDVPALTTAYFQISSVSCSDKLTITCCTRASLGPVVDAVGILSQ